MSTKVTFNVCNEDMDYTHSPWDCADYVLSTVNRMLIERGISIEFKVENYGCPEDMPEKFWNDKLDDYVDGGIEIVETIDTDDDIEDFGVM